MRSRLFPALASPSPLTRPRADLAGALAGSLVSLPQTLAYGALAVSLCGPEWMGLGVLAGLYGGVLTGVFATLFGHSPVLVTGPRAATTLVLAALLGQLIRQAGLPVPEALAFGAGTVVLAGIFQALFGLLRLGRMADYIPYPVVAGFLNGSALLIIGSQLGPLLGVGEGAVWSPSALALALLTAGSILAAPRVVRRIPPMVVGLGLGCGLYYLGAGLGIGPLLGGTVPPLPQAVQQAGLAVPEAVLAGLMALDGRLFALILPAALSIAALSSLDTVLSVAALEQITLRRGRPDRDLIAQGAANIIAGAAGWLPGSGSMARTSAMLRAGGRSALAPLIMALAGLPLAWGLGPLLGHLPQAVMAGLLLAVGVDLFDRWTLGILRRMGQGGRPNGLPLADLLAVALVVATTLAVNLVAAVGVGVAVSLLAFVVRIARSPVRRCYRASALAARLHGDQARLDFIHRHGDGIAVVELDGALFFGSVAPLRRQVDILLQEGVRHVILDLKRVRDLDATAARVIDWLAALLRRRGGLLALAYVEPERRGGRARTPDRKLWRSLAQAGCLETLGADAVHPDLDRALEACEADLRRRLSPTRASAAAHAGWPVIFQGLGRVALRRLRAYADRCPAPAGTEVFRQGDDPDSIYFLAAGRAEVSLALPRTDRRLKVQTLAGGAIFGEMAVLDPKPRSASVTAVEDCVLYRLAAADFARLKAEQPDLAFRLLENVALIFAERLRASNVLVTELEG